MGVLYVALGGAVGAAARYGVGLFVSFPFGTLTVNLLGSFLLGLLIPVYLADRTAPAALFLLTGMMGGFTTFSTFSADAIALIENGQGAYAAAYVVASVIGGVACCFLGLWLGREVFA